MARRGIDSCVARLGVVLLLLMAAACGTNKPPVARPIAPPPPTSADGANGGRGIGTTRPATPTPVEPVAESIIVPPEPLLDETASASLDDLNRTVPLKPVFFELDSAEIGEMSKKVLDENAGLLGRHMSWAVTVEGHCDERGSAEYNLALGERRALAARAYLLSLGISADRVRTVSYGKEFPFDPGHEEAAFSKNRRAHFVITTK